MLGVAITVGQVLQSKLSDGDQLIVPTSPVVNKLALCPDSIIVSFPATRIGSGSIKIGSEKLLVPEVLVTSKSIVYDPGVSKQTVPGDAADAVAGVPPLNVQE